MDNSRRKRDLIFWGTGILLLIGVIIFLSYSIGFLVSNTSGALGNDIIENAQVTRFNLDGLQKLGLTQQNPQ